MPLLLLGGLATLLGGAFVGSQIDDAIDKNTQPVGGGVTNQPMPYYVTIPLVVVGATAAYFITKKLIKKL